MNQTNHRPIVAAMRRERMRTRLLAAALTLAAEHGLQAVTIDQVIAQAQVSRGTFYKYFDTPDALMLALGLTVSDAIIRTMHPFIDQLSDRAERVTVGIRSVLHLVSAYPTLGQFMVRSGWPITAADHAFVTLVGKDLQTGMKSGRFAPMPLEVAQSVLAGTLIGAMHAVTNRKQPKNFPVQTAAAVLRALGIPADEALSLSNSALVLPVLASDSQLSELVSLAPEMWPAH